MRDKMYPNQQSPGSMRQQAMLEGATMTLETRLVNGSAITQIGNGLLLVLCETPQADVSIWPGLVKPDAVCEQYYELAEPADTFVSLRYKNAELIICTHCYPGAPESMDASRRRTLINGLASAAGRFSRKAEALASMLANI